MHPRVCSQALASVLILATAIPAVAQLGTGEFITRLIGHDGYVRTYDLYVPPSYDGSEEWPLLISFHGYTMSAGAQSSFDGFAIVADTAHFLIAYPQGLQIPNPPFGVGTAWNVNGDFGGWDDIRFAERIIEHVDADYAVDLRRVHATGYSFGGMMSFAAVCRLSDRIASIGAVAGPMMEKYFVEGCPTARPVSILQFHGTADGPWHPYTGITYADWAPRPVPETLSWWARHNNCSTDSLVTALPDIDPTDNSTVTRIEYPGCEGGTEVVHYRIENGGHSWPGHTGPGTLNMDIDATALIWDFLSRHRLPHVPHGTRTLTVDVEMAHALAGLPDRFVGVVGNEYPLDWQTPYQLYNLVGGNVYGASIAFSDTLTGPIEYRFVHYNHDGSGMVEETTARSLVLSSAAQMQPVVFWNNENEQPPHPPVVSNPPDGAWAPTEVELEWSPGTVGGRFEVDVDDDPSFAPPLLVSTAIRDRTRIFLADLDTLETYYWRVRAENTAGVSPWAGPMSFRIVGQAAILKSPDHGAALSSDTNYVRLEWEPYPGRSNYQVSISTTSDFSDADEYTIRGGKTWYDYGPLASYTVYSWRVRWMFDGPWSPTGQFTTAEITSIDAAGVPTTYRLSQNYPNPFNPTTAISYELPHVADVRLTILDLLGRKIRELAFGLKPAGTYEVLFEATGLPSGVYFYRLEAGEFLETRSLVLLR